MPKFPCARSISSSIRLPLAAKAWLAIVGVFVAAGLAGSAQADSAEERGHDIQHKLSEAKSRAERARERERALAGDIASQSERIDAVEIEIAGLRGELASLESQLTRSQTRLRALEHELNEKTRELARARRQHRVAQGRLSERVVGIYTSDQPDLVAFTLGAESLEVLIDQLDTRKRLIDYDADLVSETKSLRALVTRERARTASLRTEQAAETSRLARHVSARRAVYSSLAAQRDSLSTLRAARQDSLASVQVERQAWEKQANALEAESARVASLIAAAPAQAAPSLGQQTAASSQTPSSSGYIWPVRGTVVSPFGQRWGRLHAGIDIAAPAGTPVVASAAGHVIYAGSMSGYGLMVVVQHGGGVATAYAHNSSISVSVGQAVAQGQAIAAVGCTGHCFGDHLHFEVRVGGSPVGPMGYL